MKQITGGATAAKGFQAACTAAGIKYENRTDMAMIYSQVPCRVAGTFTTNLVKAAPVLWDRDIVKNSDYAQAVVVNAGIATDRKDWIIVRRPPIRQLKYWESRRVQFVWHLPVSLANSFRSIVLWQVLMHWHQSLRTVWKQEMQLQRRS